MHKDLFAELQRKIKDDEEQRRQFIEIYGHIRRPMGVELDGKIWMAFDGGIYQQEQEGPYNFINAIHDHALHFFGEDFLDAEDRKDLNKRHPAIQWLHIHLEQIQINNNPSRQDGNGAAWFRFAYDLFTIRDNSKLEADLKDRLLRPQAFQAARYELKVAAICATAGFDLLFEDETDNTTKHPEFIGTDRISGTKIAVEAKSRHRNGVLGFDIGSDSPNQPRVGIRRNVIDAYGKCAKFPFYVFIDANLPTCDSSVMKDWENELEQTFLDLDTEGYADPCPANAILITNDPSHYVGSSEIGSKNSYLWVRCFTALNPSIPHPSADIVERLLVAHKQRVSPPSEFYENS